MMVFQGLPGCILLDDHDTLFEEVLENSATIFFWRSKPSWITRPRVYWFC